MGRLPLPLTWCAETTLRCAVPPPPAAVDVLGRSWMEFQYYPEYETELLPCVGQPSCELYTNPDFWLWADDPAQCPECQNCPECQRSLRVTYR